MTSVEERKERTFHADLLFTVPVLFPKLPPIRREISLDDIADVRVEDKKIGTQYNYRVMMVLTTGESLI